MLDIQIISDKLEPMERAEGWVLMGIVKSQDTEWLILQGPSPLWEIKTRERIYDPNFRYVAGKEPHPDHWKEIMAGLCEVGFLQGPTRRGQDLGRKRRQAAVIMSAWAQKPLGQTTEPFQCVINTTEGVTTEICHTCLLKEECRAQILKLGVDPNYTDDIKSAKLYVPGKLEMS